MTVGLSPTSVSEVRGAALQGTTTTVQGWAPQRPGAPARARAGSIELARAAAIALAVAVFSAAPARAQPTDEQLDAVARAHFDLGTSHYDAGRFAEAAVEFREAYRFSHRPELLYNIHLAERDAGHLPEALDALRAYLASEAEIGNRGALEGRAASMERQLAEAAAREAGGRDRVARAIVEESVPPPVVPPPRDETPTIAGAVLLAAGVAMVAAAAVTGALALTTDADLARRCPGAICTDPALAIDIDRGRSLALATDVVGAIGIAALATGLVLVIVGASTGGVERAMREGRASWTF